MRIAKSLVKGILTVAGSAALPLLHGCASGPHIEPITAQTPFEQLQKNVLLASRSASVSTRPGFVGWFPVNAQDTSAATAKRADSDFEAWCQLRQGYQFLMGSGVDAPLRVKETRMSNGLVMSEAHLEELDTRICQVGSDSYVLNRWVSRTVPMPGQNPGNGYQGDQLAWVSPSELTTKLAQAKQSRADHEAMERYKKGVDDRARVAAAAEEVRVMAARTKLLKGSPSGTALACEAGVLAQGMSAPLNRVLLNCEGFKFGMKELVENGWQQVSMTSMPDGDFGGVARMHYDIMYRKM